MKVVVLYKSKYGAAKKYVEILKEMLPCDAFEAKNYRDVALAAYDWILFSVEFMQEGYPE